MNVVMHESLIVLLCLFYHKAFLHILAGASEYDELPVRHNEVCFFVHTCVLGSDELSTIFALYVLYALFSLGKL